MRLIMIGGALNLGTGLGWRPELALSIARRRDLGFVEIIAENFASSVIPLSISQLRDRGVKIIPHGVALSLGGADHPDHSRLESLGRLAEKVNAPFVSEHVAFVRAAGTEAGHLLPIPRTREALDILVENVLEAKAALPVPLALENIATLVEWPHAEMDEAAFLSEALERTDTLLLMDVSNLYANAHNHDWSSPEFLDRVPLERLAYVHIAGGIERGRLYHDTHAHAIPAGALELLEELCARVAPPGVLLERDDHFPPERELIAELEAVAAAIERGRLRRELAYAS